MEMNLVRRSLFGFFLVMLMTKLAARVSRLFFLGLINLALKALRTLRRNSVASRQGQLMPLSL
jgi:hypothetical protein